MWRVFVIALAIVTITGCKGTGIKHDGGTAPDPRPNIICLFVDDLGWGDITYRKEKELIPNINQLAAEGISFTDAYSASPTCSPSRASLISGQHPAKLKIVRHIPWGDEFGRHTEEYHKWDGDPAQFPSRNWLPLEIETYGEALKELNYNTAFIGKWHLGHEPYHPIHQGFDQQFGVSNFGHPPSYYPPYFKGKSETYKDVKEDKYLTDQITDDAVRYIENYCEEEPFHLSLWYYAVHTPHQGRKDLVTKLMAERYEGQELQHAALMACVDESIGRIRSILTQKGIAENTVILFLGDQGGLYDKTPLRGNKRGGQALYEGSARIPCIIYWPGITEAGSKSREPVTTLDVFPTIIEMAGGRSEKSSDLDGRSLIPLIKNKKFKRDAIYLYRSYEDQYAAIRSGKYKMIAYRSGKIELFDLEEDLSERNDLSKSNSKKVEELKLKLQQWEEKMGVSVYNQIEDD